MASQAGQGSYLTDDVSVVVGKKLLKRKGGEREKGLREGEGKLDLWIIFCSQGPLLLTLRG